MIIESSGFGGGETMLDKCMKIKMISVVRNFDMYDRLVKNNSYNENIDFITFDNRQENLAIPQRYNSFLDNYDYSQKAWFVFCHEDWQIKEKLALRLENLDENCLYGPIGAPFTKYFLLNSSALGEIEQSEKSGEKFQICGRYNNKLPETGTFDCQCLIVHSSLIYKYHLRFDSNLLFDLYVEDFCINARENYKILSKILQLKCRHWSLGTVGQDFYKKLEYLKKKYSEVQYTYYTTVKGKLIVHNKYFNFCQLLRYMFLFLRYLFRFVFQIKKTKANKLLIKVLRIPVYQHQLTRG